MSTLIAVIDTYLFEVNRIDGDLPNLPKGKKAREIAFALGLGYETVKTHRKNIYLKLQINSLVELANRFKDGI